MYSREAAGDTLEFGVSGKLIRNVLVMYDRQTDSLWSQLIGTAVQGPLAGTDLEYVPALQTTWADWKERHPETQALVKGYSGYRDPYTGYYLSGSPGVIGETISDGRLSTKQFVIGVETDDATVAFPFSALNEEPLVNTAVGNQPVVVAFDAVDGNGAVFSRELDDTVLTFELEGPSLMTDDQTGSTWDPFSGEALSGELSGRTLNPVKSTTAFWFGWKDFHPDTLVYGIDG